MGELDGTTILVTRVGVYEVENPLDEHCLVPYYGREVEYPECSRWCGIEGQARLLYALTEARQKKDNAILELKRLCLALSPPPPRWLPSHLFTALQNAQRFITEQETTNE